MGSGKPILIFDWGGVLSPDDCLMGAEYLSKKYNYDYDELYGALDDEGDYSRGSNYNGYLEKITKRFGIPGKEIIEWKNKQPPNETLDYCYYLKKMGYDLYLLSDQMKFRADYIQNTYNLSCFTQVFFSCEIGYIKPNKNSFLHVLDAINVEASNTIFIDDNIKNIEVAKGVNITGVLYKNLDELKEKFEEYNVN